MPTLQFEPVANPWLLGLAALVLIGLLWVKPKHVTLPLSRFLTLAALRCLVIALTLLATLRPTFVYTESRPQQVSVVVAIDDSRSMQVADGLAGTTRYDMVTDLLSESASALSDLAEKTDLKAYRFSDDLRSVNVEAGRFQLPSEPEGEETSLGYAMAEIVQRESSRRILAFILLSDGAQRATAPRDTPPQEAVQRLVADNVPLFTFVAGQAGGRGRADLRLDGIEVSDTIFAKAPTTVRTRLVAKGYANQTVNVQLLWETESGQMEVVATKQVLIPQEATPIPLAFETTPEAAGEKKVLLRVDAREGELVTANNQTSTFVSVREGGIRVLYIAGSQKIGGFPGLEQRFARAALATSPDISVTRVAANYVQSISHVAEKFEPGNVDVVILDNVDSSAFKEEEWKRLAESVRQGTGLAMLGGYHSFGPGGFRDNPLNAVLPIGMGPAERQNFEEPLRNDVHLPGPVVMRPTAPLGLRHPLVQLGATPDPSATRKTWQTLPPLDGANRFDARRLKKNASILVESVDEQAPLLIISQPGVGRSLAMAGDSTFRWVQSGDETIHLRYWRQLVLWLARKDDLPQSRVWVRLPQRRLPRGSRIDLEVGAHDDNRRPIEGADFQIVIEGPDEKQYDVLHSQRGGSNMATFRETREPGDYLVRVAAKGPAGPLGEAVARFVVPDRDLELDRPAAEPGLLAQLALATEPAGGAALAPEELPILLEELAARPIESIEEVLARYTFWDTWPFLITFVAILTIEWYLRKRWGLV